LDKEFFDLAEWLGWRGAPPIKGKEPGGTGSAMGRQGSKSSSPPPKGGVQGERQRPVNVHRVQ